MTTEEIKTWTSGFNWADDSDDDSSDDEMEMEFEPAIGGCMRRVPSDSSLASAASGTSAMSSSSSSRLKFVRWAPIAEMRLIPNRESIVRKDESSNQLLLPENAKTVFL
mmetsp:Transcript_5132/g.10760  ORF Transcript_5132/g.10760 Transcript_5132/m.10760 type:complete len:109 (-) Transcript_5132:78-404(-)|eukprot:CAMPEP_0183299976 /NCGR_PEP_ID=MMETSP0160_2-20130417/6545_1 /TAXON_ID=2839 ORGANISM="Odontella Sinensis, Strain Grunow 1884" /NCGR_SAMPLE_ID=MMETSP0160_2 /ASSEMBLY_ACC=CAM_ASM_000250 /LENGTH=108 /DNA_ID=CAMNT_0025462309 /DNA_START=94 /DNA_END=420 /DNA_ORIENTATION=-